MLVIYTSNMSVPFLATRLHLGGPWFVTTGVAKDGAQQASAEGVGLFARSWCPIELRVRPCGRRRASGSFAVRLSMGRSGPQFVRDGEV